MQGLVRIAMLAATALWLLGCGPSYSLVKPAPTKVAAGALEVQPTYEWNRASQSPADISREETWTQNGAMLDSIGFIGGLEDGESIMKPGGRGGQNVPVFRSTMSPQDLASMIESYYRIRGVSVFETSSIRPVKFLGENGVQFDYHYVAADEVKRRGRAVMAIHEGKLYMINLSAAAIHYFDAALPEFEALAASAKVPNRER